MSAGFDCCSHSIFLKPSIPHHGCTFHVTQGAAKCTSCIDGNVLLLQCTFEIYMTAIIWGNWLTATFIFRHSSGRVTAKSPWVSANHYTGVLDSLYSADSKYNVAKNNSGNREMHRCKKRTNILTSKLRLSAIKKKKTCTLSYWQACILVPGNEREPRGEAGVMVEHWLGGKVSR